jgi:ornithine cyclodeaminase/alanine dehydrogenase-like protein (mu-crystallin family)
MLVLSETDVKRAIDMDTVLEAVMQAYRDYSDQRIDLFPRVTMTIRGEDHAAILLPANDRSNFFYGFKQASSFPSNMKKGMNTVFADIHLYSAETGEPVALVSANHLTAMKTGAASAVATKFLAKEGEPILAIIGTGLQAYTQLDGIQRVRPLKEVRLYDTDHARAQRFAEKAEPMRNRDYPLVISGRADACVSGADIVVTATPSLTPVFSGDSLSEGTHLNAVGSFTPHMQEIDTKTVLRASKIVTDNQEETWAVAGDLLVPLKQGKISRTAVYSDLGDIVAGKKPGRENDHEITIYESVGFAALDIAVAAAVYRKAAQKGLGTKVDL